MIESRTKKTARNMTFGTANQVVSLILNFISRTIFIKILGPEYLGINGLFANILTMLSMADLGFGTAMVYSYYKPLAENNHKQLAALTKYYKKIYNIIALSVAVIGLALVPFLQYLVNLDNAIPYLRLYYLFFLANTVISYLFIYKTSIINADQKNYLLSKYQMLVNFMKIILQIIFLLITKNYFIYLIIQIIATFANNIIASRKADRLYPYIKHTDYEIEDIDKKSIFENMKSVAIYKFSMIIFGGTDNILTSIMVGTVWVGYYSNYYLIINALDGFINILYSSATASIGNAIVKENPKRKFSIFQSIQSMSLIITTFTTVCFYVLISDFIFVWLGPQYILASNILFAITLNFYITGIVHPIWSFREATGLYRQTKYVMLIAAIENLVLSIFMGRYLGMAGILFATAISRLTTYFWYEPKLLFNQYFNEKVRNYYIPLIINVAFTSILIAVFIVVSKYFVVDSWSKLIIKIVIVVVITLSAIIIAYRKTKGYQMILSRAKGLIKR